MNVSHKGVHPSRHDMLQPQDDNCGGVQLNEKAWLDSFMQTRCMKSVSDILCENPPSKYDDWHTIFYSAI